MAIDYILTDMKNGAMCQTGFFFFPSGNKFKNSSCDFFLSDSTSIRRRRMGFNLNFISLLNTDIFVFEFGFSYIWYTPD